VATMSKRKQIANNIIDAFIAFYNAGNVNAENMKILRESFDKAHLKKRELVSEFVRRYDNEDNPRFEVVHGIIEKWFS
jgi:hypothetical protein